MYHLNRSVFATVIYFLYHTNSRYMKRRCWFLDNFPAYNYNTGAGVMEGTGVVTNTKHLGSMLMEAMISEAEQFCHPSIWESGDYCQVKRRWFSWLVSRETTLTTNSGSSPLLALVFNLGHSGFVSQLFTLDYSYLQCLLWLICDTQPDH